MTKLIKKNIDSSEEEYQGVQTSLGATSAGEFPVLDPSGKLDNSLLPDGVGADEVVFTASEAIASGAYFYITSTGEIANADATSYAKKAVGFTTEAGASGALVKAQFDDTNSNLSGLTVGADYFLSDTTAGGITETAPTGSGVVTQRLGVATSATSIHSDIESSPVIRA